MVQWRDRRSLCGELVDCDCFRRYSRSQRLGVTRIDRRSHARQRAMYFSCASVTMRVINDSEFTMTSAACTIYS